MGIWYNGYLYVSTLLNHPRNIIKEIPNMIHKRISEISCDQQVEKAKGNYSKALQKSGFSESTINNYKYHKQLHLKRVRTRKLYGLTLNTLSISKKRRKAYCKSFL